MIPFECKKNKSGFLQDSLPDGKFLFLVIVREMKSKSTFCPDKNDVNGEF